MEVKTLASKPAGLTISSAGLLLLAEVLKQSCLIAMSSALINIPIADVTSTPCWTDGLPIKVEYLPTYAVGSPTPLRDGQSRGESICSSG